MSLTDDFLIIGTETGTIRHYLIEDENQGISNDYSHEFGIKSLYPNINGTLVLFIDSHYKAYLLNAVDGNTIPIPVRKEG
jgi:hypothetical protein